MDFDLAAPPPPSERSIFQVSELLATLKHGLEMNFPALWVEGEVSNFVAARSGHWYFTLKDDQAQIRCAFFRYQRGRRTAPADGQRLLAHGRATVFPARGELQLVLDDLEEAGAGALHLAFERLKRKLAAEGLFEVGRKRALPASPRVIGVLSSPVGAAIHDVLTTLRRRQPLLRVILYPVPVQGSGAAVEITHMLEVAVTRDECDVLLLTRGGGSLEDLMAFNDEGLARAIAACPLPVVSAVGHEVDFSISDLVADVRAATPTAAAELLSHDQRDSRLRIQALRAALQRDLARRLKDQRQTLAAQRRRLALMSPRRRLEELGQRLDLLNARLQRWAAYSLAARRQQLHQLQRALRAASLHSRLARSRVELHDRQRRLRQAGRQQLSRQRAALEQGKARLEASSPERVLARGYAIAWRGDKVLRNPGDAGRARLRLQLATGKLWVEACGDD